MSSNKTLNQISPTFGWTGAIPSTQMASQAVTVRLGICSERLLFRLPMAFGGAVLYSALFSFPLRASEPTDIHLRVQVKDLNIFNRTAYIPASFDPASLRFEKVIATTVRTKIRYTTDPQYCHQLVPQDPGGSMFCPHLHTESPEAAYEVTYAYTGPPLASDEYGNRNFVLHVYFREDEIPSELRRILSVKRVKQSGAAAFFQVTTFRDLAPRVVIDEPHSDLDHITYKTISVPSDYVTVKVDLVLTPPLQK